MSYDAIYRAASERFDISWAVSRIENEMMFTQAQLQRPSVLYRPKLYPDGNQWCALYGDDIQAGLAGFGDTPAKAMEAFDEAWRTEKAGSPVPQNTGHDR